SMNPGEGQDNILRRRALRNVRPYPQKKTRPRSAIFLEELWNKHNLSAVCHEEIEQWNRLHRVSPPPTPGGTRKRNSSESSAQPDFWATAPSMSCASPDSIGACGCWRWGAVPET